MPFPAQNLTNDIIDFSANCSTRGSYGAAVNLTNQVQQYGEALKWTPFKIVLDATAFTAGVTVTPACFAGNVTWVNGLIHSVDDARGLSEDLVRFNIKSFFSRLSKKPVNTERYENVSAVTVMTDLLDIYATIPAALRDLSGMGAGTIRAVISGNNILDEMKKVAQVAHSDLFVQRDGVFTVDVWKDAGSAVDVDIPPEAVISASVSHGIEVGPTRITVRGRYVSVHDAGDSALNGPPEGPDGNDPDEQGPEICTKNGISQAQYKMQLRNVFGVPADHRNAKVVMSGFGQIVRTQSLNEGGFNILINAGGSFIDPQTGMSRVQVTGRQSPLVEWLSANTRFGPLRGNQRELGGRVGFAGWKRTEGGLLVTLPGPAQNDNDKNSDEPELTRVEVTVEDPGLKAEFGVVGEQIDNVYATKLTELFDIAVRRFQEFRMQRRTWQVETAYLPCLSLNQKVTFVTPDTVETVTGLLTEIKVNYAPSPTRVRMTLVVEDFFDIGATSYTSSNLFLYPDLNGADAVTDGWLTSTPGTVFMFGGYAGLVFGGALRQTVDLVSGDSYTVTFDVVEPASPGTLTLSVTGCGAGVLGPVGAGSHTFTFTASCSGPATFKWTGGGAGAFLRFPKLTRTTTA